MSRSRDIANLLGSSSTIVDKTIIDAKGDLLIGSSDNTVTKISSGNNGQMLMADSSATAGLRYVDPPANRNAIINGGFDVWQRGTSFTANQAYTADRWIVGWNSTPTVTMSRQAFTPGTAPVAGFEGTYFFRTAVSEAASMTLLDVKQRIEDVRTFAGQTVTLSFYAKADATRSLTPLIVQFFGSGGSSDVVTSASAVTLTTSWARYSVTIAVPSISEKTIGVNSYLEIYLRHPGSTFTIDLWGVQVEAGSVATRFKEEPYEATLRKCQRYYTNFRSDESSAGLNYFRIASGQNQTTTQAQFALPLPVKMRTSPTLVQSSTASEFAVFANNTITPLSSAMGINSHPQVINITVPVASGLVAGQGSQLIVNNNRNAWFALEAEL